MRRPAFPLHRLAPLALVLACAGPGRFVWMDDYVDPPTPQESAYLIRRNDVLNVFVWNQRDISAKVRVREDGRISLPLVDDVEAVGRTPAALARGIQEKLRSYLNNPTVTVLVEEAEPLRVAVLGEVKEPGMKTLEAGSGLAQALAMGGGFTDYAQPDMLYVLRRTPGVDTPVRIRFTYNSLVRTEGKAAAFRLRTGDVVVVE